MACAARAERIFYKLGDVLRLARLDSNVGNILFRRDRPQEALERYQRALEGFEVAGEPRDSAAALSNLAVASINLGRFREALGFYERARAHCELHGLKNLRRVPITTSRTSITCGATMRIRGGCINWRVNGPAPRATNTTRHCAIWTKRRCFWN